MDVVLSLAGLLLGGLLMFSALHTGASYLALIIGALLMALGLTGVVTGLIYHAYQHAPRKGRWTRARVRRREPRDRPFYRPGAGPQTPRPI